MQLNPDELTFQPVLYDIGLPGKWVWSKVSGQDFDLYLPATDSGFDQTSLQWGNTLNLEAYFKEAIRFVSGLIRPAYTHEIHGIDSVFIHAQNQSVRVEFWFHQNEYMLFYAELKPSIINSPSVFGWGGMYQ